MGVSVLLPGTVRTNMASSSRNRPTDVDGGGLADVVLTGERETGTR